MTSFIELNTFDRCSDVHPGNAAMAATAAIAAMACAGDAAARLASKKNSKVHSA